ncbi:hypothetical protein ACEWY4_026613 [Coilia grayii]|uniref:Coiled-coil protein 142 C-terminal domain-containing protein n=1 Tax=Coilia grayii TaxID=363190 RepID=A0ABD1IR54_9TELE
MMCHNWTSRSSARLQSIEQTVADLSTECHILWDCGRRLQPRGYIKGLSPLSSGNAFYHSGASTFSQHYGQLQCLLEERAKLMFLHEYSQRWHVAYGFVTKLSALLDHKQLLLVSRRRGMKRSSSLWNLGLQALAQELRVHLNHSKTLHSQAYSNVYLRKSLFWWRESLHTMFQSFQVLGLQSLFLMEQCIYTSLCVLATEHLSHVPRDAIEDLLACIHIFNYTVKEMVLQNTATWKKHIIRLTDWPNLSGRLPKLAPGRRTFTVFQIMKILAEQRGQMLAKQLYLWNSHPIGHITGFGLAADTSSLDWNHPEQILSILSSQTLQQNHPGPLAKVHRLNCHNKATAYLQYCSCYTDRPFWHFLQRDCECLEILFQALVSSSDLLLTDILDNSKPGYLDPTETVFGGGQGLGERKLQPRANCEKQKSVQWRELIKSELHSDAVPQYQEMLWTEFSNAAIRCLFHQGHHRDSGSLNQWKDHMVFLLLIWLTRGFSREIVPVECLSVLKGLCSEILYSSACMHWDEVMCDALGHSLKDRCVARSALDTSMVITATTERLLQLFSPLSTILQHLNRELRSGNGDRVPWIHILGSLWKSVTTVQVTTFWVTSRAYQFLTSWNIDKFLLITQGDLVVLHTSLKRLSREVEDLNGELDRPVVERLAAQITRGAADLKDFSDLILRIFSMDCKRMSVEIFEQTMPSAKHWRVTHKTELPSNPSEYATCAARSVLGRVLEGVQLLPEEARSLALTEAMTVFMEAWMEHILKQKIKFSIQGALQLKQDFDLIRDLIRSEEYSLSEELHQKLLSLRVFQQVDSAILCLLQQPMSRSYMPSHAWEPFRHCCPGITHRVDQADGSLNNLDSMDVQAACRGSLTQAEDSLTPELVSALPDSYFPQAQQEWLDLRIHNNSRWKLPGLHCLSKSEP